MSRVLTAEDFIKAARKLHYRTTFAGLPISIENRKGSLRHWNDPETGESGSNRMAHAYGYIRGFTGADGDAVDVFLGPHADSEHVFIVNQRQAGDLRAFDEHKVMLGFRALNEARAAYLRCYDGMGPKLLGSIREWTLDRFKKWLVRGDIDEPVKKGGGPYIGPKGGKWADAKHTIPWKEPTTKARIVEVEVHPKISRAGSLTYYVSDADGDVQISHYEGGHGPTMPRASLKHFVNDLAGRVDLPKSGNADINAVIDGSAKLLGKGDDGIAFHVGDKVVKVSTTVPFQPDNPGHRSPGAAADMLRQQTDIGNTLADKGIPVLRSTFVKHGDKGFQIKPYVEIPKKLTRKQLDEVQEHLHLMHAAGFSLNDQIQVGVLDGKVVFYDTGKAAPNTGTGMWASTSHDIDRLEHLYTEHGERFVNTKAPRGAAMWDKADEIARRVTSEKGAAFASHWVDKAADARRVDARATLSGKRLDIELDSIDMEAGWMREDIGKRAKGGDEPVKKAGGPFIGPKGGLFGGPEHVSASPCRTCNRSGKIALDHSKLDPKISHALGGPAPAPATLKPLPESSPQMSLFRAVVPGDLFKGEARGGKYIKRVPYTDAKGKRRYRYYYSETAVARDVSVGDALKLGKRTVTIDVVAKDGTITLRIDGRKKVVAPTQWADMLSRAYGPRYHQWAHKRAEQAINAVLRHVPREALADLKGSTDEERLAELRVRVPKVYAKLQRSFAQAGVSPFRAKQILSRSLERRKWEPEARAAVLGSILTQRVKATSFDQIVRAAENLSGGYAVEGKHASAALELRAPGGDETKFVDDLKATAERAERELAKLSALLARARHGDKEALTQVLVHGVGGSAATHKMAMLGQAFPGLRDDVVDRAREVLAEIPSVAPTAKPKREGAHTAVYVAGEGGQPTALRARYVLMEADAVIVSHDPTRGFQRRQDYPEGIQERAYHRDQAEQGKVIRNAQTLNPSFVFNTNPDAVNGPPVVTADGHAFGGNSRTMSMQLAYAEHPEKADALRAYMADHAHEAGFSVEDVKALKNPVLVRVIDAPPSKESQQLLVRQLNESFTQAMDPRTMQVALGRKLDEQTLAALGNDMGDDETLAAFLRGKKSERFVNSLMRNGIIDNRNASQYLQKGTKILNEDGRVLVERILVGRLIGDADVLSNTKPSVVGAIANAIPYMIQAKAYGKGYDVGKDLAVALDAYNSLQYRVNMGSIPALDAKMKPEHFKRLFNYFDDLFTGRHPVVGNPSATALLELMIRKPGPQQQSKVWWDFAKEAARHPEGQGGLLGDVKPPEQVFRDVVARGLGGGATLDVEPEQGGLFGKAGGFREVFGVPRRRP